MDINVEPKRSQTYQLGILSDHWSSLAGSDADHSFWSKKTGATISVNSLCEKYESASLNILSDNLLRGIDDLTILKEEKIILDERESKHTIATGKLDGVLVKMNIYVLRKNYCIYDLSYSSKTNTYDVGTSEFEQFVKAFHAW